MLPPEFETAQPMGAQALPQLFLGRRHLLTQFLGPLLDGGCGADATNVVALSHRRLASVYNRAQQRLFFSGCDRPRVEHQLAILDARDDGRIALPQTRG